MRAALAILTISTASLASAQPIDYRRAVLEYARTALSDPYSVRDPEISKPMKTRRATVVCMRLNAKNKFGAYVGLRQYAVPFFDEKIDDKMLATMRQVGDHSNDILCKDAEYEPFTELADLGTR